MRIGGWLGLSLCVAIILIPFGILALVVWSREGLDSLELLIAGLALVGLGVVLIAWDDAAHSKQNE